nr:copia protein [Tanacetum cinerariifolium]
MYSFFANQSNGPQLDHEDLEQVDEFDLEEMNLKCQVAMIYIRLKKFYKKTGRKLHFDATEPVGFDKTKVERRDARNTGYKARDNGRRTVKQDEHKAMVTIDGEGVDWSGHAEDDTENYALMAFNSSNSGSDTEDKSRLGYGNQINEEALSYDNEVLESVFASRSTDVEDSYVNDRFAKVKGMHSVPPPMTRIYMPPKSDFRIDESNFTYDPKQSKTCESDAKTNDIDSCESSSSVETLESVPKPVESKPKAANEPKVWFDAPMIEEYESDSDDEYVFKASMKQEKRSCAYINTVKHVKTPRFPVNAARQNLSSQAASTSTVRKVNTARPIVNKIRPRNNVYKSHSPIRRSCNRIPAPKAKFANHKITTAGDKTVSVVRGNRETAVKPQQVVIGDPKDITEIKSLNTIVDQNIENTLKGKGIVDSGCSRHMTGNKAYLVEYEDFIVGPVAFGDTECLVLSPDFKLTDKNQVLLRVPRQNNMYTFNLENIIPSGGLAYLIEKATVDESNKWHRSLEDIYKVLNDVIFTCASYDDEGAVANFTNLESTMNEHRQEEGIDYDEFFAPVARIEAIRIFLAFASYVGFIVYQMNVKSAFLYGKIDEKVYVSQPLGFIDPKFPKKKSWCDEFQELIKSRFQMSYMGELTFFLRLQVKQKEDRIFISQDIYVVEILKKFDFMSVKTDSTLTETKKPLVKDAKAADVDVHLYRSMIGSLMYLTASRPDIMYLKGQLKLGLWYPRVSVFDLEAYLNSDYAGANLDMKSTTGGCDPLELVDGFTPVEEYACLLETRFDEEVVFVFVFPEDVTGFVNLTLLALFIGVTTTNLSLKLLMQGQFVMVFVQVKMSRDVLTVGSTKWIPLLFRGEYSQSSQRFMNYLEEQMDEEAMINSIKNGDQPLPILTQVLIAEATSSEQPPLKDKSMWSDQEKKIRNIDHLARSLLIQGLPNDIYSLIDINKTAKDLWDALERHMLGSEYGEQDRKAAVLYEYETFKATEGELLLDTYIHYLQVERFMNYLEEQTNGEAMINSIKNGDQPLPRATQVSIAETSSIEQPPLKDKSMWSDQEKNIQKIDCLARSLLIQGLSNDIYSFIDSNKTTKDLWDALARHMLVLNMVNKIGKLQFCMEFVKTDDKKVEKKDDEKKRDMSKVKCYNCKKEGYFEKDRKKVKVKDYEYYKTKMLLTKKDKDEQVLLAEDQAWMESSNSEDITTSVDDKIYEVSYYLFESESESEYETSEYYENTTTYGKIQKVHCEFIDDVNDPKTRGVILDDKKVEKKDDEKKRDTSKVKCYNCKKEGHFSKDCKKAKIKYYNYYKTKMLLAKKDNDEQVLLAEDQAWMESSSDSD